MSTTAGDRLIEDYLARLRRVALKLPLEQRAELIADIEEHLMGALPPHATEAEVRQELDRLGDPSMIVAADAPPAVPHIEPSGRGVLEWAAIVLLLIGAYLFLFGWLVGAVLLWTSRAWTVKEKLIGTFVIPGGLFVPAIVAFYALLLPANLTSCSTGTNGQEVCTGGSSTLGLITLLIVFITSIALPILVAIFLAKRAARPTRP